MDRINKVSLVTVLGTLLLSVSLFNGATPEEPSRLEINPYYQDLYKGSSELPSNTNEGISLNTPFDVLQYPHHDYIRTTILNPIIEKTGRDVEIIFSENEENRSGRSGLQQKNGKLGIAVPAKPPYSENILKGWSVHEGAHIICEHAQKNIKLENIQSLINRLPSIVIPAALIASQLLTKRFPLTPTKVRALIGLAAAPTAFSYAKSHRHRMQELEADLTAARTFKEFNGGENLISALQEGQRHNLCLREAHINALKENFPNPIEQKIELTLYDCLRINENGDSLFDNHYPPESVRIKALQEELLRQNDPSRYNQLKQEQKDTDLRAHMTV